MDLYIPADRPGFEPECRDLYSLALPIKLPTELVNFTHDLVPAVGLEPTKAR